MKRFIPTGMRAAILALGFSCGLGAAGANEFHQAAPLGFDQSILYYGTGVMDFSKDSPRPGITGCRDGMFCTGLYFQKAIMRRSDAEIAALEQEAKQFFYNRFGIAVDDWVRAGLIRFRPWTLHPDFDYRAYMYRGKFEPHTDVPLQGWVVRDGGWIAEVIAPEGVTLDKEFKGLRLPKGASVLRGNYNILATDAHGRPLREIVINYRSLLPIIPREDGSFLFRCELDADDIKGVNFKEGLVFGHIANYKMPDGRIKGNGRNAITFPPESPIENLLNLTQRQIDELTTKQVKNQLR